MRILTTEKTSRHKTDEREKTKASEKTSSFVSQVNAVPDTMGFAISPMIGSGFDRERC